MGWFSPVTGLQESKRIDSLRIAQLLRRELGPDGLAGKNETNVDLILRGWVGREEFQGKLVTGLICKAALENQNGAESQRRAKVTERKPLILKMGNQAWKVRWFVQGHRCYM